MYLSVDTWIHLADTFIDKRLPNHMIKDAFQGNIFFVRTDLILDYVSQLTIHNTPFILITASNDDHCSPYLKYPPNECTYNLVDTFLKSSKLIRWYCKNPCVEHPKIRPLPLGPKWQWETAQFFGEDKTKHTRIFETYGKTPHKNFTNPVLKNELLFFNFKQKTTIEPFYSPHKNVRLYCKSVLLKKFEYHPNTPFETYIKNLSSFKFCMSPPGRGIDTHRTWEALMVGTIPIVFSTMLDPLFKDLPVLIIQDIKELETITSEFLEDKYKEFQTKTYNFDTLYEPYWINKIKSDLLENLLERKTIKIRFLGQPDTK